MNIAQLMAFSACLFIGCIQIRTASSFKRQHTSPSSNWHYIEDALVSRNVRIVASQEEFLDLQGKGLTTFLARYRIRNFDPSTEIDLVKEVVDCEGSRYITVRGLLNGTDNFVDDSGVNHRKRNHGDVNDCFERSIATPPVEAVKHLNRTLKQNLKISRNSTLRIKGLEDRFTEMEKEVTRIIESQERVESVLKSIQDTIDRLNGMMKTDEPHIGQKMRFDDSFKGKNVVLSDDSRTATRKNETLTYGYGGVTSQDALEEGEVFEVRISSTNDEWRDHGIAIGVITKEGREQVEGANYVYYNAKETWAIRSLTKSPPGKSNIYKDNVNINGLVYPLDTRHLPEGTTIGVSRSNNGNVDFHLNGINKGTAFEGVPRGVYAFVDVIAYVNAVSIAR